MKCDLTPAEPTPEMKNAGVAFALNVSISGEYTWSQYVADMFRTMNAAAPDPLEDAELVERVVAAVKETWRRYVIEGTSEREFGGPPFRAPWYLIDAATAEPEVNWPGELVGEFDDPQKAYDAKWGLVVRAAITAMKGE